MAFGALGDDVDKPLSRSDFKDFLFSHFTPGEKIQFDLHMFQMGGFNHQLVIFDLAFEGKELKV